MSRRRAIAAAMLACLALTGCGDDEPASEPAGDGGSGFDKSAERDAFRDSKQNCGAFSVEQVAREYGGDPSNPLSVATAYAEEAYVGRFQGAARDGCLEGLQGP
jgi:hypothetical protein